MIDFSVYPPTREDTERLARYCYYEQIFDGDYKNAFATTSAAVDPDDEIQYLGADWGALISKVSSDMLFSKPPTVAAGKDQKQLDQILSDIGLFTTLAEAAVPQSFRGDAVLKLEWDSKLGRPAVTEIPATNYFVEVDQDNNRRLEDECIAWKRTNGKDTFLRVDRHSPGRVQRECYLMGAEVATWQMCDPDVYVSQWACTPCDLGLAYPKGKKVPDVFSDTGIPRSAVFFAPNMRHGSRYWGYTDYMGGLPSLFDAFNGRLSENHGVLDEHARPKLILPQGVLDKNGEVEGNDLSVIQVPEGSDGSADSFRYLIWDAQMLPAYKELEVLEALIFKFSETSPAIFGADKAGSIESGRAMKFRFQRTLAKIARKIRIWGPLIVELIWHILTLAASKGMLIKYADETEEIAKAPTRHVSLTWRDGLPVDKGEQSEVEGNLVESGLSSRESALVRINEYSPEKAQEELQKMKEEKEKYGDVSQPRGSGIPGAQGTGQQRRPGQPGQPGTPEPEPATQ